MYGHRRGSSPQLLEPPERSIWGNLVGYWPLASSGVVDLKTAFAPQIQDLTNNAAVSRAAGPSNNVVDAAAFSSASSQYLSRASNSQLQFGNVPFSIVAWVYLAATGTNCAIVGKDVSGAREFYWNYVGGSNRFSVAILDGVNQIGIATSTIVPVVDTWYFCVVQCDTVRISIEVNRSNRNTGVLTGVPGVTATEFRIGARSFAANQNYMNGRISQLGYWKRILQANELDWLYNNGQGRDLCRGC